MSSDSITCQVQITDTGNPGLESYPDDLCAQHMVFLGGHPSLKPNTNLQIAVVDMHQTYIKVCFVVQISRCL